MRVETNNKQNYIEFSKEVFEQLPDYNQTKMVLRKIPHSWKVDDIAAQERIFIDVKSNKTGRKISIDMANAYINYINKNYKLEQSINDIDNYIKISLAADLKIAKELHKIEDIQEDIER